MPLTSKAHLAAVKTALDELPPPLHVRATCKGCPHPAECKAKPCLNDIARPSLEANAFSRLMLPAQARAFEDALRAGKSLRMITGGLRQYGPAIASILKFRSHCAAYPLWGKQMKALAAANALANNKLKGTPHRHTTHCKKGHELPGEPNWTHPPSAGNLAGTRYIRCMVCFNENQRRGRVPGEEVIGRVMVRLLLKRPINSFTKGGEPGYLLSHKNFTAIRKAFPEIDRLTRENMKDVNSRAQQERHRTDESEHTQAAAKKAKKPARAVEVTFEAIDKAVPPHLPTDLRSEVINDIWVAARDGLVTIDTLKECAKKFVASHNRMFPVKYAKFGKAPLLSLDATLFDDGTMTRGDTVTEGFWQ